MCLIVARGWWIRGGKWNSLTRLLGHAVLRSLFFRTSFGEGGKRTENSVPLLLTKIVGNIIHVFHGVVNAGLRVKPLGGLDEVAGGVHPVCPLDLNREIVSVLAITRCGGVRQLQRGQESRVVGYQVPGPQLGGPP